MYWDKPQARAVEGRIVSFAEEPTPDTVVVYFEIRCELPRYLLRKWVLKKIGLKAF